jgi:hypothetical protein
MSEGSFWLFLTAHFSSLDHKTARNCFPIYLQDMFLDLVSGFHEKQSLEKYGKI